jgi:hypothetical protein
MRQFDYAGIIDADDEAPPGNSVRATDHAPQRLGARHRSAGFPFTAAAVTASITATTAITENHPSALETDNHCAFAFRHGSLLLPLIWRKLRCGTKYCAIDE